MLYIKFTLFLIVAFLISISVYQPSVAKAQAPIEVGCTNGIGNTANLLTAIGAANNSPGKDKIILGDNCTYIIVTPFLNSDTGLPLITDDVTIEGNEATLRRFSGNNIPFRLIKITNGAEVEIKNITLAGGAVGNNQGGGAILAEQGSTLTLDQVQVRNNSANFGGGVATLAGTTIVKGTVFDNNQALSGGGGGLYTNSSLTVNDSSTFSHNIARRDGGGIAVDDRATVVITHSTFEHNQSETEEGGGIYTSGPLTLLQTDFLTNTAQQAGGGLFGEVEINITGGQFSHNRAIDEDGGGLLAITGSSLTINEVDFTANQARTGGGLATSGSLIIKNGLFEKNKALVGSGGGIHSFNTVEIDGTKFLSNEAELHGGGVFITGNGELSAANVLFDKNKSLNGDGGGIFARTTLDLGNAHFTNNQTPQQGGGIFVDKQLTIKKGYFLANEAQAEGGAITAMDQADIQQSTFYKNQGDLGSALFLAQFNGGQSRLINNLWVDNQGSADPKVVVCLLCEGISEGSVDFLHNTLTHTTPSEEEGVLLANGTINFFNNIITNQALGFSILSGAANSGHNLYFGNTVNTDVPQLLADTDIEGQDPLFVAPERNFYQLQPNSPAIDQALATHSSPLDYRDVHRPQGDGPDIGAFEFDEGVIPTSHEIAVDCNPTALVVAIAQGNEHPGANRLKLTPDCTYSLTDIYNTQRGPSGLPTITEHLIIEGNGATIQRDESVPSSYRLLTIDDASLALSNLTLQKGDSLINGGAINLEGVRSTNEILTLNQVTVQDNFSNNDGGGLWVDEALTIVEASHFSNNRANEYAGGILAEALQVKNSTFINNAALESGGAIDANILQAIGNRFIGNSAADGAAIDASGSGSNQPHQIINNLWLNNEAVAPNGSIIEIFNYQAIDIFHNTLVNSSSTALPALSVSSTDQAIFRNNIVSNFNTPIQVNPNSNLISENNLFFNNTSTTFTTNNGNLTGDPRFVDANNGDFRLGADSPAIDTGQTTEVSNDIDNGKRPLGAGPDIGAYEFGAIPGSAANTIFLPIVVK